MKIIVNKFIPFKGFGLMNIFGLVFSRKEEKDISLESKVHEQIHTLQQYELFAVGGFISLVLCNIFASWWYLLFTLFIPFILYVLGFLLEMVIPPYHNAQEILNDKSIPLSKRVRKWITKVWMDAYHDNCFEREAYANDKDVTYLINRNLMGWVWYIIPKKDRKP